MSEVVNVVARFSDSHDSEHFLNEMKKPAYNLISMYIAQVRGGTNALKNTILMCQF